jgi:hypothetical protein
MSASDAVVVGLTVVGALILIALFWLRNTPPRGNTGSGARSARRRRSRG